MKLLVTFLFTVIYMLSQNKISFLQTSDVTTVREIEREIVKNIIDSYNKKNTEKLEYQFVELSPFPEILNKIKNASGNEYIHSIAAINSITNLEERKSIYDFSSVYLPAFDVVFSLKNNPKASLEDLKKGAKKVTYHLGTSQEKVFFNIKNKFSVSGLPFVKFKDRLNALFSGKVDYSIGDNVEVWDDKRLKIIYDFDTDHKSGFVILYPKGSKLRKILDKHLNYYIKSTKFKSLIKNNYGTEVNDYFRKNL